MPGLRMKVWIEEVFVHRSTAFVSFGWPASVEMRGESSLHSPHFPAFTRSCWLADRGSDFISSFTSGTSLVGSGLVGENDAAKEAETGAAGRKKDDEELVRE